MPLSEHEQHLLDQIERELYAEDPKFASNVRSVHLRRPPRRRKLQGAALFVVGIGLLVTGLLVPVRILGVPVISVVGFLFMFFGALMTLTSLRQRGQAGGKDGASATPRRSSFAQRMEERLRKRFEDR
ncbi:MAG: DUF3040 domain-containing protein [Sciscionella sp.]